MNADLLTMFKESLRENITLELKIAELTEQIKKLSVQEPDKSDRVAELTRINNELMKTNSNLTEQIKKLSVVPVNRYEDIQLPIISDKETQKLVKKHSHNSNTFTPIRKKPNF